MRKYMKYEIKGSYKFILGILAILVIASSLIQFNVYKQTKYLVNPSSGGMTGFGSMMVIVSALVIFGAFLTAIFYIIGSFKKELYEDRGYLTFTLPLTGNQILGAKLMVAALWYLILGISIVLYNGLLGLTLYGSNLTDFIEYIRELMSIMDLGILSIGIVSGLSVIMTVILIYFSMALSRVSVKNKKIGGLWFVIFLILNALSSYIVFKISSAIPYFIDLNVFKILHYDNLNILPSFSTGVGQLVLLGRGYSVYMNVVGILSHVAISVGAFLATGYIIEKKIDL